MNVTVKVLNLQIDRYERLKKHLSFHKAIYKAIESRELDRAIKEDGRTYAGSRAPVLRHNTQRNHRIKTEM